MTRLNFIQKCERFWTPYNDVENEGHYVDYYTKKEYTMDWEPAQPNGLHIENNIVLMTGIDKVRDVWEEFYVCLSCMVPFKKMILRGICKNSFLGSNN